jgi:hypothetical protein
MHSNRLTGTFLPSVERNVKMLPIRSTVAGFPWAVIANWQSTDIPVCGVNSRALKALLGYGLFTQA